ncbi:8859_t:CDS:2, partial [Racocetra persica]
WFVQDRNTKDNTLIVVPESNNPLLFSQSLVAKNWTWYLPPEKINNVPCNVIPRSNGKYVVEFETPQRAIAPGQLFGMTIGVWEVVLLSMHFKYLGRVYSTPDLEYDWFVPQKYHMSIEFWW